MSSPFSDFDFSSLFGRAPAPAPEPDPFGRIGAGDPLWDQARDAWMNGASLRDLFGDTLFDLNGTVGNGRENLRGDVFKTQSLMHQNGVLDATATGGPTGYWGSGDDAAMRRLQESSNTLTVDGWVGPGGETIGWLRDLYMPPQGVQLPDPNKGIRESNLSLATTLGLDPDKIDLDSPDILRGLGATRFYHHFDRLQKQQAMGDIERLRRDNPELAGQLRGKVADSIANPVWEIPMMTPERLDQAIQETQDGLKMMKVIEGLGNLGADFWDETKPKTAPKVIRRGMSVFDIGAGKVREGFEQMLEKMETEKARRNAPD